MSTQPAYRCETCGMTAHTDDLTVIGRNCFATDFEHAHVMVTDTPTPGDDWRDDAATYGGYSQVFLAIEAPAAVGDRSAAPLDSTDFSLTGEQARVAFTALAEHAALEARDGPPGGLPPVRAGQGGGGNRGNHILGNRVFLKTH